MTVKPAIIYTLTDEAPTLATYSLLPIVQAFATAAGLEVETRDISLAGRILAAFPDYLKAEQRQPDDLAELGTLILSPAANIIKLPNISASLPQLSAAIRELQGQGCALPDYPQSPANERDRDLRRRYGKVMGSAVNPVLREGNSDRRAPASVKRYAQAHPHAMGAWVSDSPTHVATMTSGDFFGSEQSLTLSCPDSYRIEFTNERNQTTILKPEAPLLAGEVIDACLMRRTALREFLEEQLQDAKEQGALFSIHLKATMMKVSDPIIFGHAVAVYFRDLFEKHAAALAELGVNPNNGAGELLSLIQSLPPAQRHAMEATIEACRAARPPLAMVNSDKGISNLHVPSDIIIDASMPAAIRASGKMWGPDGQLHDIKAVIPDRSYAGIYQEVIDFCKEHGAFDPATMGSIANVGLMASQAEEYGSHDKTFEMESKGLVRVLNGASETLLEHEVEAGDIWRMCQTKDAAIQDWVGLAISRARAAGCPAIFWLNPKRAHDSQLIEKVESRLAREDIAGLELRIMPPKEAMRFSLERMKAGKDAISVTGNVLRDYLTDLFPILELGTSAKMLSIVRLMKGGSLLETGAGGSAPKHVQQFQQENHLRWDSLGEFLALSASLEHLASTTGNDKAQTLAKTLDKATEKVLMERKSPSRKVGELDNRGSHFYLALYWAEELARQEEDPTLQAAFTPVATQLAEREGLIVSELNAVQGQPVELGGYYRPDPQRCAQAMRPSPAFNEILARLLS